MFNYDPRAHYWKVLEKEAIYSSEKKEYVGNDNAGLAAYLSIGGFVTKIETEQDLREVLAAQYPEGWPADFLKTQAKERLVKNDAVFIRCGKDGIEYPAEWCAFDETLRAIINGTSELTAIPEAPAYPS